MSPAKRSASLQAAGLRAAGLRAAGLLVTALLSLQAPASAATLSAIDGAPARKATASLAPRGTVLALVIFARFADESGSAAAPSFAADLFDPTVPGSISHFFAEMSRGQFRVEGEVLPRVYASSEVASAYTSATGGRGDFGGFTRDILGQVDADVDFGRFDNDGPDGVPNSGDDDGFVDLLLVVTQSIPRGFITGDADGVAALGLTSAFTSADAARTGAGLRRIRVGADADGPFGTLQRGPSFSLAVGIITHEICHLLGLPDLYDLSHARDELQTPAEDSGGIGYWGLMGHGARGFNDRGGPTPLSAWSLKRLGWLGVGNGQLVVVDGQIDDAPLRDVHAGGRVYQLPIDDSRYLLVEHRSATGSHYDRHLPGDGVLIWRIDESRLGNDNELGKLVDVVCADGLFSDAGFPVGAAPLSNGGGDNLDFWSYDEAYRVGHAGNLGDATDLFDGVRFRNYGPLSNPAINGFSVADIRPTGDGFVADLSTVDRRRAGQLLLSETWRDTVDLVGDLTVPTGLRVDVEANAVIRVADDGLRTGTDPARIELNVAGTFSSSGGARFVAPGRGAWQGLVVTPGGGLLLRQTTIEGAVTGITADGANTLNLTGVTITGATADGIRLTDVAGTPTLTDVTVDGAGGAGLVIDGGQRVSARDLVVTGSGGPGVERADGGLELSGGELTGNGGDAALWLRDNAFGTVEKMRLSGIGTGVRIEATGPVTLQENSLRGYQVAVRSRSASPRVIGNVFAGVDTVLHVAGFRVPARMQLNIVETAGILVANGTEQRLDATRNWWGTQERARIAARMLGPVDWDPPLGVDPRVPVEFALQQNYPNPFNAETAIEFSVALLEASLRAGSRMHLDVRTIGGGLVRRLVDTDATPGVYRVVWDGRDAGGFRVASGVYYYELSVDRIRLTRRLTVLR